MNTTTVTEPRRAPWRQLTEGSTVWSPHGESWRAATVIGLGKNRGDRTVVHLVFETGGRGSLIRQSVVLATAESQWSR
jgi:hypothetical protein